MGRHINTLSRALRELSAQYKSSFKSSDIIGKGVMLAAPLILACCLCAVPILIFAPDPPPTPEIPTLAELSIADVEILSTSNSLSSEKPASSPKPTSTIQPTNTATSNNTPTIKPTGTPGIPGGVFATVINVIDGDTIEVEIEGVAYQLRYIGIDTPERGEPFAAESTAENEGLVAGKKVILVSDVSETDRFGRLLRYVYLEDGTLVNAELVRSGFAQAVAYPPDIANDKLFRSLQEEAQDSNLGLWNTTAFLAPTETPIPQPTNSPVPVPSDTPLPLPTNTQAPLPTNTIAPLPTDTIAPVPTDTPLPQPTQPPIQPANVQITFIYFDGQVPRVESDEYAEISNRGGSMVNLAGWRLNAGDPGQDFWFPDFDLQPGQSCRVYTNEHHPETCGFSFGSGRAIWNNSDRDCGHLYDNTGAEVSLNCY